MKIFILGFLVLLLGAGAFFLFRGERPGLQNREVGEKADAVFSLSLQDNEGRAVSLASFQGTPLVVNSWAVWCPFCREELLDFAQVQEEFGDRVVIVAIDRAESLAVTKRYTDEAGVTDRLIFWLDPQDSFYRAVGGFSMPETIFIDKDGIVKDHKRGPMEAQEMRTRIENIL